METNSKTNIISLRWDENIATTNGILSFDMSVDTTVSIFAENLVFGLLLFAYYIKLPLSSS
jgi:hypothetical protein